MPIKENKEQIEPTEDARSVYNNSLYDDYVAAQAAEEAERTKYQEYADSIKKAQENKTSVMKAVYDTYKPKYDEKKDTDLRKVATIQSLGDMLSAAARGYFAYRDKGAGVVPNVQSNSALSSVEELNRMRETYLAENKQWRDLMADYDLKQAEAEVSSAKEAMTEHKARMKEATARKEDARKSYNDAVLKKIIADETAAREAERMENSNEQRRLDREAADRRSKSSSDNKKKEEYTLEDYNIRDAYRKAHPRYKTVEQDGPSGKIKVKEPYSQEDYDKLDTAASKEEMVRAKAWWKEELKKPKPSHEQDAKDAQEAAKEYNDTYEWLISAGYSPTEAREMAAEVIAERFPHLGSFEYKPAYK